MAMRFALHFAVATHLRSTPPLPVLASMSEHLCLPSSLITKLLPWLRPALETVGSANLASGLSLPSQNYNNMFYVIVEEALWRYWFIDLTGGCEK